MVCSNTDRASTSPSAKVMVTHTVPVVFRLWLATEPCRYKVSSPNPYAVGKTIGQPSMMTPRWAISPSLSTACRDCRSARPCSRSLRCRVRSVTDNGSPAGAGLVPAGTGIPSWGLALTSGFTMTAMLSAIAAGPREPESAKSPDQYGGTMPRHARIAELPVTLPSSGSPLRHRVADAIIDLLRTGHLRPGDELPSTRALAGELAISRSAVLAAYDELAAAGFIQAAA